ncbi:isoflavone reductase [Fusarium mexicanum]|uniref:Isoflavone reductase n=1 Tax=Fusarium mexicanum TaxID=751941 RepID=A0A8H5IAG6_9HYPO|nr:isoflavone reductase [Fusarium mexicanum]
MKVAILGATGQNGTSIVNGLLASTKTRFDIAALVRPSSLKKPKVIELQSKGVNIVSFSLDDPEDHLAAQLQGIDVLIICCLIDEAVLANAAKKAGVKRYVPCFYATVMPRGIQTLRDTKETTLDHIQRLHLPYTVIDVGWWYQISLPRLPSGCIDRNLFLYNSAIGGTGDILCARTDSRDVGRYVARIITDPRTLNQKVFAYTDLRTQHELYDTVERISGEKIERKYRTADEIDDSITRTKDDPYKMMDYYQFTYQKSYDIMGENAPDYARYLGYQVSKDLYPDMEGISFEDFIKETLEHGLKPMYEEYADMLRGSSSFIFDGEAIAK